MQSQKIDWWCRVSSCAFSTLPFRQCPCINIPLASQTREWINGLMNAGLTSYYHQSARLIKVMAIKITISLNHCIYMHSIRVNNIVFAFAGWLHLCIAYSCTSVASSLYYHRNRITIRSIGLWVLFVHIFMLMLLFVQVKEVIVVAERTLHSFQQNSVQFNVTISTLQHNFWLLFFFLRWN